MAVDKLKAMRTQAESGSNAYRAKPFAIMEKEVAAALAVAQKDTAGAEKLLKEATAIELTLDAPSGPAEPIKPSFELYGELLIDLGPPAGGRGAVPAVARADAESARRRAGASEGCADTVVAGASDSRIAECGLRSADRIVDFSPHDPRSAIRTPR